MDGMEKLIYVHVCKLGESLSQVQHTCNSGCELGFEDSENSWYVIKRLNNGSSEISPIFDNILPLNHPDPALEQTTCQVIGSCIYEIGGWSVYSRILPYRSIDPGSSKIRCLDTRNPNKGWQTCFTLPFPVCGVQSAVVDDQWLYLLGGHRPKKGGTSPWGYALNVDDFSKGKEISKPSSSSASASHWPVVSCLSPGTLVAYFEDKGILHQLDCATNSWSVHVEDLPCCKPADAFLGACTISDGILYIIDLAEFRFISYDIPNKKLTEFELPTSFAWGYDELVNLVVLAENKFCIVWGNPDGVNTVRISYIRFSLSYHLPNCIVVEEKKRFNNVGGISVLNVVAV